MKTKCFAVDIFIKKLYLLLFVVAKVCIFCFRVMGTAVDLDDLMVFFCSLVVR